ncbi:MAG TPA: aromatic ring-hydroxylating dioxygenase subunit alpha [Actinophytocola sp.]|uniref:aromatic ring-hydroxylating oxygenase subunit alpha n=1 Tax=Actinophytocola sp. TaxID=1872138 RepID=UPI002DBB7260|nr:aromatic ring-hydroxylating dioxygenase subunit alpha [Actinophytocola sp.]HEU5472423.1 aromatic ring-hydroxylating dioxygenase subunit alpha [Actinophytocola sp.]
MTWPPAPLDPDELAGVVRPFGASRMLPARAYTSAEVLGWEHRHLFAGTWSCLGRLAELPAQRGATVGDVPVLLTRTGDEVRAFANTCRHRGHELLPDGGSADGRVVVCPYHGWVYTVDGALAAAPRFRDVPGFDPAEHGLVPLPARVWHGWVFVNATGDAPPFEEYAGALTELVAPYAPDRLTLAARHSYEVRANWKLLHENYQECYHCPRIHPELCAVSPPDSGDNYDLPGAWVGGSMDLRDGMATMSVDGRSGGVPLPGVDQRRVRYLALLPDLLLSLHPDYVMTHRMRPVAPDRTRVECSWLMPGGVADPTYAVEFWDRTNRQDWAACESVQRGLASPHFRPGPFAPNEDAVHQWVTLVGRAYRGDPPWAGG